MEKDNNDYVEIYDTTLRDGTQAEDFNLSLEDKIRIALKLDEFGMDFIEGGWPGSNPKDEQFFKEIQSYNLKHSVITAFGSTHQPKNEAHSDHNLNALINSGVKAVTIFGKTWDIHVKEALKITHERNLELILNSCRYLKTEIPTLFYDAEHFFDGFKANKEYAIETIKKAEEGGAECIVLCDTNGGTMPYELTEIIQYVKDKIKPETRLGIHCHNDSEMAVANSLLAVKAGITQVQGTMNGFGERCGNANLCSIIPGIVIKLKYPCNIAGNLKQLTETSRFISEIANLPHNKYLPYVGVSAFAHKGGIHVSAVQKNPETYEHIRPELVGNVQRILVSDLSGKSNILAKAKQFGLDILSHDPVIQDIVTRLKELENEGFQYEAADASFEILIRKAMGTYKKFFELVGFRVIDQKTSENQPPQAEATVMIRVGGHTEHTAAVGNGPVNALDNAIRKALEKFYPELKQVRLEDYKVRVLPGKPGTESKVRVLIESSDHHKKWGTVGVSEDIIEASWQALLDSVSYKLMKEDEEKRD